MHVPLNNQNLIIGLALIIGAVQCFAGYRIFKVVLGLTGFIVGGVMGAAGGYACSQNGLVALFAGLVGGCLGAALLTALYFLGVFLVGAFLGGIVGAVLLAGSLPQPALLLIPAVIAGVLALVFQRFMIIVSTAFVGAWTVVTGVAYFTTGTIDATSIQSFYHSAASQNHVMLLGWLVLGVVGVIIQYSSGPNTLPPATPDGEPRG